MSSKNLRKPPAFKSERHITDLPSSVFEIIFANCSSTDLTRCSLVNKMFRERIEDMEDDRAESLRSCQKAKIFICDRRRAILEGVSTITPARLTRTPKNSESSDAGSASSSSIASTSSSDADSLSSSSKTKTKQQEAERKKQEIRRRNISDRTKSTSTSTDSSGIHSKATTFISDQYTDTSDPNWAFAFNFEPWLQEYDVNDVYFKNFCSFLEREKLDDPMSPSSYKGRTAYYESNLQDDKTTMSLADCQIVRLNETAELEMKSQSAGRIERLAERLSSIRNAHFIFKDSVCYGARPPVTIFYFLSMMEANTRALTFDHVQSATAIELHELINMANLHRLTVIQPQQRQSIMIREELLINWMKLPDQTRKRISVHLVGCNEFRPQNLYHFVEEWLRYSKPVVFKQISIDGGSYKYNEFMNLIERLHDIIEKRPPRSPLSRSFGNDQNEHSIVLERTCRIPHPQDRRYIIQFKYCKPSRRMVLTIEKDTSPIPVATLSPVSTLTRLTRPQSAASAISSPIRKISSSLKPISPIPTNNNNRQLGRPLSHDPCHMAGCRDNVGSNVFTRIVSFLGTSS
uniref:F-box domain-containing protein n=1 Tax=Caenorhabditis tropicalis TaxID=1561998 RepID=A0A1I7U755_9PELO